LLQGVTGLMAGGTIQGARLSDHADGRDRADGSGSRLPDPTFTMQALACVSHHKRENRQRCATAWNKQCRALPAPPTLLVPSSGTHWRERRDRPPQTAWNTKHLPKITLVRALRNAWNPEGAKVAYFAQTAVNTMIGTDRSKMMSDIRGSIVVVCRRQFSYNAEAPAGRRLSRWNIAGSSLD
jgi:hypothetical protein